MDCVNVSELPVLIHSVCITLLNFSAQEAGKLADTMEVHTSVASCVGVRPMSTPHNAYLVNIESIFKSNASPLHYAP